MSAMIGILLALLPQDTETISRLHAASYQAALFEYDRAIALIDSDPKAALEAIDRVFAMPRIDRKDRLIRFERVNGQLTKAYDFFPNHARGRIRLALAQNDPKNAPALLASAVQDLKASADAGVKSSEPLLKTAKAALERLKPVKTADPAKDPSKEAATIEAVREAWFKLIEERQFKAAQTFLDSKGASLPAEKKREFAAETESRCRKFVSQELDSFLKSLEVNHRAPLLRAMKSPDFARAFKLPADGEIVGTYPELDWSRRERAAVEKISLSDPKPRSEDAEALVDLLLGVMTAAEPLQRTGENRWFKDSAQVTFGYVEDVLQSFVVTAKDADAAGRRRVHDDAERIRARWVQGLGRFPRDYLRLNGVNERPKMLATIMSQFPVDLDELDRLDVDACLSADVPDAALDHLIQDLDRIREQQGARLSRDDSRRLLTQLVAATAIRQLLAGRSLDETAREVRELGKSLVSLGGPPDPARWGPKIEKIFESVR